MTDATKSWDEFVAPVVANDFTDAEIVGYGVSLESYLDQRGAVRGDKHYQMTRGDLCAFDVCPSRWRRGYHDDEGTKATDWGQLMDTLVLGVNGDGIAIRPATYINDKGEEKKWSGNSHACQRWLEEHDEMLVVSSQEHGEAVHATEILLADEQIAAVVKGSKKQVMVTGYYVDRETGIAVPCKGLIDLVPPADFLADLKTCNSAHPRAWQKAVFEHDYHVQAALYLDLWNAATGEGRDEFRHVLQESYKPWQVAKRILSVEYIAIGREKYRRILKRYAQCLKTGDFPDYDEPQNHELVIDGWKVTHPIDWMLTQ